MVNTKLVVQVNNIKKLIDLNGDKTNFELSFNVKSVNDSPFEAIVVSQTQLDSGNPLEYKKVSQGVITGNIIADKNVYQNYFLLLKSDTPLECEVEINIKEIPPKIEMDVPQYENIPQDIPTSIVDGRYKKNKKSESPFNLKKILLILLVIIGIGLVIWFLYKKKPSKEIENNSLETFIPSIKEPTYILPTVEIKNDLEIEPSILQNDYISSSQIDSVSDGLNTKFDNKLFTRLNNIKIW